MKKQHLGLLCLLFGLFLLTGHTARAQNDTTLWMALNEYRVHDQSIFEKNYPIVRSFWLKADSGIENDRIAHTSESGRIYGSVMFKGSKNFGDFMGRRIKTNDAFNVKQPAIYKENMQNVNGPTTRSNWMRIDSLSSYEPGYKIANFDFRKMQFITVTFDKTKEFEAAISKRMKMDVSHGIKYNFVLFKCVDGYPTNTYMLILPDKSITDYYKNLELRNNKRDQNKAEYDEIRKELNQLSTVARIDHLFRVK
ncbi:MAG: hypothetical protein JWQ63_278 [Mucilaginibacter sp.]|jgi:hypothetical protein|nr:hypothetical protein [Mucilaginibacter sp.]